MPRAVKFEEYGDIDVLEVVEVARPVPGPGQVLVRVRAAGINIGEAKIRRGLLHAQWPATFPSGQGSDLAGVVEEIGSGVSRPSVGDEVLGRTDGRASQADYVVVEAADLVPKPPSVPWEVAGSLYVAGTTAYATVRAVSVDKGDTVVVAGAAGGVGTLAVQLASMRGARVIGLAGTANHQWLRDHGVVPVSYGEGTIERIHEVASGVDAFIDAFGADYVEMAIQLGVHPDRIDTIANFDAVKSFGVKAEGSATASDPQILAELVDLVAGGRLEVPIAACYPLTEVREAYRQLEGGHVRGKIVLVT